MITTIINPVCSGLLPKLKSALESGIISRTSPVHGKHRRQVFCLYLLIVLILVGAACAPRPIPVKAVDSVDPKKDQALKIYEEVESPYFHYIRSELHMRAGDFDRAIDELIKAVNLDPASSFLKKELITLYLHKRNTAKALKVAQKLVKLEPKDTDALLIEGKLRQMLNQNDEAKEIYLKVLQLDPDQENAYLYLGQILMDSDNTDEAFRLYAKMAKHFPDSYAAHFFLGRVHAIKNNPEYAEKEFLKTLAINPTLLEPRFELISIYENQDSDGTIPETIRLYLEILEIDNNNIRAELELSLFYHTHGQETKASEMFALIGERSIQDERIIMMASQELLGEKRFKEAAITFTGMLKGAPQNSTLEYLSGIAYDALKQTRKAIYHFQRVKPDSEYYKKSIVHIALSYNENELKDKAIDFLEVKHRELPDDIDIVIYLSAFYEEINAHTKSIAILSEGIKQFPDNVNLIFRLGVVQDKVGQKSACIQSMQRVIELDPNNANALNYLGYTYADMGENLDIAEALILKALTLKPEDGFITDSLGWVYYRQGLFSKAVPMLQRAVDLTDADPVITEHLGDAYLKSDRLKDALETYKKARSKSNDENSDLDAKIQDLEQRLNEEK
jgi:tetratricopeptide (TPR) repeat protein